MPMTWVLSITESKEDHIEIIKGENAYTTALNKNFSKRMSDTQIEAYMIKIRQHALVINISTICIQCLHETYIACNVYAYDTEIRKVLLWILYLPYIFIHSLNFVSRLFAVEQ